MEITEETKKEQTENVLPLINIVFLLLIFFMIAGTLIQPEALSVIVPDANVSTKAEQSKLTIIIDSADDGTADDSIIDNSSNNTLQFSIGNDLHTKAQILEKITSEVKKDKDFIVQLKADSNIKSKHLIDLMDELGTTGLLSIRLLTLNNSSEQD